jgi:hypothetical protein
MPRFSLEMAIEMSSLADSKPEGFARVDGLTFPGCWWGYGSPARIAFA